MKGYFHSAIRTADLKRDDHDLTNRSSTPVNREAVHAPMWRRRWGSGEPTGDGQIKLTSMVLPGDGI
jgi:hypothetical protein